jgi:hypothetical protein
MTVSQSQTLAGRSIQRYWIIAPVESDNPDLFDKVWQFDLSNDLISIGWTALGDVSSLSRPELAKAVASAYPDKPSPARGLITNMMWNFYHEIAPGDFVIARRGRKILAGIGRAVRSDVLQIVGTEQAGTALFLAERPFYAGPSDVTHCGTC